MRPSGPAVKVGKMVTSQHVSPRPRPQKRITKHRLQRRLTRAETSQSSRGRTCIPSSWPQRSQAQRSPLRSWRPALCPLCNPHIIASSAMAVILAASFRAESAAPSRFMPRTMPCSRFWASVRCGMLKPMARFSLRPQFPAQTPSQLVRRTSNIWCAPCGCLVPQAPGHRPKLGSGPLLVPPFGG